MNARDKNLFPEYDGLRNNENLHHVASSELYMWINSVYKLGDTTQYQIMKLYQSADYYILSVCLYYFWFPHDKKLY